MNFLLITFTIMASSILLIRKIASFFGLQLQCRALVLCAIMAFIVNFAALTISAYLTRSHFVLIFGMVIVSAALVTYYNEKLLRRKDSSTATALQPKLHHYFLQLRTGMHGKKLPAIRRLSRAVILHRLWARLSRIAAAARAFCMARLHHSASTSASTAAASALKTSDAEPATPTSAGNPPADIPPAEECLPDAAMPAAETADQPEAVSPPAETVSATPLPAEPIPESDAPLLEPAIDLASAEPETSPANDIPDWMIPPPAGEPLRLSPRIRPAEQEPEILPELPEERFQAPVPLYKTVAEIVREDMENDQLLKLTAAIAKLGSLDDILDYAYEQKQRHNYSNAIFAYKRALDRYQNDAYAPFIVIDLGNIYKETGSYDEAIHTYTSAFNLPTIASNDAMQEEFKTNLIYLRTVQYILMQHNASKTPFNKIPPSYMREIELTFQNRRTQKNVS